MYGIRPRLLRYMPARPLSQGYPCHAPRHPPLAPSARRHITEGITADAVRHMLPHDYGAKRTSARQARLPSRDGRLIEIQTYQHIGPTGSMDSPVTRRTPLPETDGEELYVFDGVKEKVMVSRRWLRDHCPCTQCVHPVTKQRQFDTFLADGSSQQIVKCHIDTSSEVASIHIEWRDGHQSFYPAEFLMSRMSRPQEADRRAWLGKQFWDSSISLQPPVEDYHDIHTKGLGKLLAKIQRFGFCFVKDCPATPEATQALLEMIGPIRNTHYGGFYDFTSDMASKDTAYSDIALDVHTDTTYFSDPAGLQAFHMLSHTDGDGGASVLVDGFGAADKLFKDNQAAYRTLSSVGVYHHASGNEDVSIQSYTAAPVLQHDIHLPHLVQVRWNNSDRAGLNTRLNKVGNWYASADKFSSLLRDPANQYNFQLQPGMPLIFDNWRVLHGRTSFTGKRRMCGAYINRDDYISRLKATNFSKERILASTVTG